MAEYIDIDQPLIFKDIRNRDVTGTIRTILKANHTELVLADVVPVRHGHWKEESDYDGDSIYVCSECGETWTLIDGTPQDNNMHYCPNCGARMEDES